jgi:hypothetical protein
VTQVLFQNGCLIRVNSPFLAARHTFCHNPPREIRGPQLVWSGKNKTRSIQGLNAARSRACNSAGRPATSLLGAVYHRFSQFKSFCKYIRRSPSVPIDDMNHIHHITLAQYQQSSKVRSAKIVDRESHVILLSCRQPRFVRAARSKNQANSAKTVFNRTSLQPAFDWMTFLLRTLCATTGVAVGLRKINSQIPVERPYQPAFELKGGWRKGF